MRGTSIITSDAGDVQLVERQFRFLHFFKRTNKRPVSPTCWDFRTEYGMRLGTWVFAVRRTHRIHKAFPSEYMRTSL